MAEESKQDDFTDNLLNSIKQKIDEILGSELKEIDQTKFPNLVAYAITGAYLIESYSVIEKIGKHKD